MSSKTPASMTTSDGVRLDYLDSGDPSGKPVVLLAGFKAAATTWVYQIKALEKAGYRVMALDARGHGTSEKPEHGNSMDRRGDDIDDFLRHLDLRDVTLVGQSMGGNSVWAYLSRHRTERIARIVIVDQTPKMLNTSDWQHGFYGYNETNIDTMFAEGIPTTGHGTPIAKRGVRIVRLLTAMSMKPGDARPGFTPGELEILGDHARRDWRDAIRRADRPILFVAGADSEVWPSTHAAASAALNPLATSTVIANDGHAANIEQPHRFNAVMLEFMTES